MTKRGAAGMMLAEGRCYITGGRPIPLRKGVVHFPGPPQKPWLLWGEEAQGSGGRNTRKGVPPETDFAPTTKGGDADVEKAWFRLAAVLGIRGAGDAPTYHKSVLTVRLRPRTVNVENTI